VGRGGPRVTGVGSSLDPGPNLDDERRLEGRGVNGRCVKTKCNIKRS